MPEGDTIFRTATTLRRWLSGREITGARAMFSEVSVLVGDHVEGVEARAKHLLIRFRSGRVLHTHMRMTGAWHVYSAGERWQRPASEARIVLEAGERVAVGFNVPVVELLAAGMERIHPALAGLGPDVLAAPIDVDEVRRRAAQRPEDTEIGDLLLDQRVVSGIGNIYRCETLFLARTHPRRTLAAIDAATLAGMIETAGRLMTAGLRGHGQRWVYGRRGRPCRRCGTIIASGRVGRQARTAYWCPRCQPP